MSLSKQLSNSLEGIPSIHLDPGDPGSPDPDCSNPEKRPAAAPPNPGLDSGSLFKISYFVNTADSYHISYKSLKSCNNISYRNGLPFGIIN